MDDAEPKSRAFALPLGGEERIEYFGNIFGRNARAGIPNLNDELKPRSTIQVFATKEDGVKIEFDAVVRIDTPVEMDYYRNGGILQTVLRNLL